MGFLKRLFGRAVPEPKARESRDSTEEEINAMFIPLGTQVCDFKEDTKLSWFYITPTLQNIAVQLFVRARGREETIKLLEFKVKKAILDHGIRAHIVDNFENPHVPPQDFHHVVNLKILLWKFVNEAIAKGHPVEHVAQAFSKLVVVTVIQSVGSGWGNANLGEAVVHIFVAQIFRASCRELQNGGYDD